MCKTLSFFLLLACSLFADASPWDQYKRETLQPLSQIHGWCTPEKANKMMDLIYKTHPQVCVEIGVFAGSSIFPTALALKYLGAGKVFAIDPWSTDECTKGYAPDDPHYLWWKNNVNLEDIFEKFKKMLYDYQLFEYCNILRMTSSRAVHFFPNGSIDILHIDGNHTEEVSLEDVIMFFPKVKLGGYIWFDDVDMSSTHRAVKYLEEHCLQEPLRSTSKCSLFRKQF